MFNTRFYWITVQCPPTEILLQQYITFGESLCNTVQHYRRSNLHASIFVWTVWMESFEKLCEFLFSLSPSLSLSLFHNIKLRRFCRNCLLTENAIESTEILYLVCFPYFGLPSPPSSITCGHIVKTNATTLEWQTLLFNNIRSNGIYVSM